MIKRTKKTTKKKFDQKAYKKLWNKTEKGKASRKRSYQKWYKKDSSKICVKRSQRKFRLKKFDNGEVCLIGFVKCVICGMVFEKNNFDIHGGRMINNARGICQDCKSGEWEMAFTLEN